MQSDNKRCHVTQRRLLVTPQIRCDRQVLEGGGRALALADLVLPDLVDVGQHLGHGQVKSGGDFLLQLRGLIDRPRQRLQRQDIVLGTDLADLQRQEDTFKMFKFKFKFKSRHLFIPQGNKSESH